MKTETSLDTPLMKQYQSVKAAYPHAIVFFRLGDFYEMFGEDAKTASPVLGLVLTARNGIPMCGVPYHSASNYISKLLKAGHRVAICEQVEPDTPDLRGRALFKREVVRLITPGTVFEDDLLDSKTSNYLVCIETDIIGWGLSCVEVSTGEFWATQKIGDPSLRILTGLVSRLSPSEIIVTQSTANDLKAKNVIFDGTMLTLYPGMYEKLSPPEHWQGIELWANRQLALKAAMRAARYVGENEPHLRDTLAPAFREPTANLQLDENAVRTLELIDSARDGRAKSLWGTLDNSVTPMGSRLLREWILQPLTDLPEIKKRQKCVAELADSQPNRGSLTDILGQISDIERVAGRVGASSASPRDLAALRNSLGTLDRLKIWLEQAGGSAADITLRLDEVLPELKQVFSTLSSAITETPPARVSDGGVIKDGYHRELDELRELKRNSRSKLAQLETREKEKTLISSLKVGYNSVFGYYIEVTKTHLPKVPAHYIRKQTLINSERFITEELKELESKILGAEDRIARLEAHLFETTRKTVAASLPALRILAKCLAELDVYYSLAAAAVKGGYILPEIDLSRELYIEEGRHPVVENQMPPGIFVPNTLDIGTAENQIMVITGPNMSGKSVYLRQNALIVIMAQIGSFVPAKQAKIGLIDRIMTRIGANDALSRGESTFMVEMKETANILSSVTPRSLILLDEIGRGTSTFDGISIAWAVAEFLYKPETGPKVLFATHYFELTELADKYHAIKNFNIEVREWTNSSGKTEIVFLHKIAPGPADKSYGIHVAELAGINPACITRARSILEALEKKAELPQTSEKSDQLLPLFGCNPIIDEIRLSTPEKLSPLEALQTIIEWKKRLDAAP